MDDRQNVTLSVPKVVLMAAKHLAIERGTSLSGLLTDLIVRIVREDEAYRTAMRRASRRLAKGLDLATRGEVGVTRESLHER